MLFGWQMVLDESEGMQRSLEAFGPTLREISTVCDTSTEEQNLLQICTNINQMQNSVLEALSQLQHAAAVSMGTTNYIFIKIYIHIQ